MLIKDYKILYQITKESRPYAHNKRPPNKMTSWFKNKISTIVNKPSSKFKEIFNPQ
jgi:hypothetical protein